MNTMDNPPLSHADQPLAKPCQFRFQDSRCLNFSHIATFALLLLLPGSGAKASTVGLTGTQPEGTPYPYTQTIDTGSGSFDVELNASTASTGVTQLYVGNTGTTSLAIKRNLDAGNGDRNQINPEETLIMTFQNFNGVGSVSFTGLSGAGTYFDPGTTLELYKNGSLVNSIPCDGSGSYSIIPAIVAEEGDVISFTPTGSHVRLNRFELAVAEGFPGSDEPYITDGTVKQEVYHYTIPSDGAGHYYLTGDWSSLTHQPDGVVVKVSRGNTSEKLYYLGATGPTSEVDFDLLVLEPEDTIQVLAGLTGDSGEDPGLWQFTLEKYESWDSRYQVPVVPVASSPVADLDIHQDLWPKNTGFRNDYRGIHGQTSVENYAAEALGHAPKAYSEELVSSYRNLELMDNYARNNPNWRAMLHWNGEMARFYWHLVEGENWTNNLPAKFNELKPYHFRFLVGTYLSASVEASTTQFSVDDPGVFNADLIATEETAGAKRNVAIVIPVDPVTGARQFDQAELVTVTAISGNQLTVLRNVYDDVLDINSPGTFPAGSYIAPASQKLTGMFTGGMDYNFSLSCPVDEQGRNGGDMVAEMLSHEFRSGGNLERYHGIMFDVLVRSARSNEDSNLDGIADDGLDPRGNDLFHLGVQSFGRKLRAALPDRILTLDGLEGHWPALQNVWNGAESEGFAHWNDPYTKRWSSGLNYRLFIDQWNQSQVRWDLMVPKLGNSIENNSQLERELTRYKLAGAAALKLGVSHQNIELEDGTVHASDENRNGVEGRLQWLGAPVGNLIRPGLSAPDELGGAGLPAGGWSSPDGSATAVSDPEGILVTGVDTEFDNDLTIEFPGISIPEGDLLIRFEGKGGLSHLPTDTPRNIRIEVDGAEQNGLTHGYLEAAVNDEGFTEVTAFLRSAGAVGGSTVTLRLIIEGSKDLTMRNFTIHNAADVLIHEFENGIVLCNSSERPYVFELSSLFPEQTFRRIKGQDYDDPVVNDGSVVGPSVELQGYRGLFLNKAYGVSYDGNGNDTGAVPVDGSGPYIKDSSAMVLGNTGNLVRHGYTFHGWNTASDGSGVRYSAGEQINITGETTLYARWTANSPGITPDKTSVEIGENGGTGAFTVVLDAPPVSYVVIDLSTSNTGEVTVSPASLTFGTADWFQPRTVTVTGVNDGVIRDDSATITASVNDAAGDVAYDAVADASVAVICVDDDDGSFKGWVFGYDVGTFTGLDDDPDFDGRSNGLEAYMGTDPTTASECLTAGQLGVGGTTTFTFSHPMSKDPPVDLTSMYLWSMDLIAFHADGATDSEGTTVSFSREAIVNGWVTVTATISGTPADRLYLKLEVSQSGS